jgi:tRNA (cmo5U34)-methyltransferase
MRDQVFQTTERVEEFTFNATVAAVFDDMLERSVPFYQEVQRMVTELGVKYLGQEGVFYDIGCSTGTTMIAAANALGPAPGVRFVGLEPSEAMREKAQTKFASLPDPSRFEVWPSGVEEVDALPDARVITLLYTLQFIRPIQRLKVLTMCQRSLQPGGCLIIAEKILTENVPLRERYIDLYHEFKARSGYTAMEISRKRQALENKLVPFMASENIALLKEAGFAVVERFFQWYNFTAFLAVKE